MQSKNYFIRHILLLVLLMMSSAFSLNAAFSKGFRDFTLIDPQRSNREIPITVWYPSKTPGQGAMPTAGSYPVIAFGHGWGMTGDLYQPIVNRLVSGGYIMLMINTETMIFTPDHVALGEDMAFALQWFRDQSQKAGSIFEGRAGDKFALMGHSMGGGAAVLSGNNPALINLLVLLAPADTNPSSSAAAPNVKVPALVFSGSGDKVTSQKGTCLPIFDSLGSSCKYFINIKGGNHCYFAMDNPMGCDLMETIVGSETLIEREEQQDILFDLLVPALDYYLKSNEESMQIFLDSVAAGVRTEITGGCEPAAIHEMDFPLEMVIYPQPASNWLSVKPHSLEGKIIHASLFDLSGNQVQISSVPEDRGLLIRLENLSNGIYLLQTTNQYGKQARRTISIIR